MRAFSKDSAYLLPALVPLSLAAILAGGASLWLFAAAIAVNAADFAVTLFRR